MLAIAQHDLPGLGHAYAPQATGPFPAILLLHGSEGARGWLAHRDAAILAGQGFLAYPHPYSAGDNPWVGGDIWQAELDVTERALAELRASALCDGRVGVYGWSRGAEHALLTAALLAECQSAALPDAVAAHAPPDRVVGAWRNLFARSPDGGEEPAPPPAWTWSSERYVPSMPAWTWRGRPIPPKAPIEIERYDRPIFLSVGDRDDMWSAKMAPRLADRLRAAGRTPELHIYDGQPHMPDPAAWNRHLTLLRDFFRHHLAA